MHQITNMNRDSSNSQTKKEEKIKLSLPQTASVNSEANAYKVAMIKTYNLYITLHIKPIPKFKCLKICLKMSYVLKYVYVLKYFIPYF